MIEPIHIPPATETLLQFSDNTEIRVYDQGDNGFILISVWASSGECLHTYCINRQFTP